MFFFLSAFGIVAILALQNELGSDPSSSVWNLEGRVTWCGFAVCWLSF
jgi:hypothetical protein